MGSGTKSIGGSNSGSSAKRPFEMPNQDQNDQFGNLFQGMNKSTKVNLNAKKLDINFDSDDFFNSFEPVKPAKKEVAKAVIIDKNEIDFSNPKPLNQLKFSDARSTGIEINNNDMNLNNL